MSYLVLARKYRPQTFDDVVQQSHVTKTLSHAIAAGRVAHALLFTGPRGTGKTTIARIVAKALNCEKGPAPTPCNQCASCIEITNGNAADVFEIDGASNNSVDQIRELRENIPYMPSHSQHKIYIIDEVHMLSLAAFNALLKTLEEPPAHIFFLFATTDPQKIPITILSRCQRHDMRRISTSAISEYLDLICKKEKFELPEEAMTMVARQAAGSLRDALSLLDQIFACSDGTLEYEQILTLFGVVSRKVIFDLATAALNADMAGILDLLADAYHRGYDMRKLYGEILEHFRNLLIVKIGHNIENLVDLPQQEIALLSRQGSTLSTGALTQMFDFLFQEEQTVRMSTQAKLAVEMVFFRLLQVPPALSIDDLILKLDALKSWLPEAVPNSASQKPENEIINLPKAIGKEKLVSKEEASTVLKPAPQQPARENDNTNKDDRGKTVSPPAKVKKIEHLDTDTVKHVNRNDGQTIVHRSVDGGVLPRKAELWEQLLSMVRDKKPSLASVLANSSFKRIDENQYSLEIHDNGYAIRIVQKHLPQLKQWCHQLVGNPIELTIVTNKSSSVGNQDKKNQRAHLKNQALSHPVVLDAIEVFSGKVSEIKILPGGK